MILLSVFLSVSYILLLTVGWLYTERGFLSHSLDQSSSAARYLVLGWGLIYAAIWTFLLVSAFIFPKIAFFSGFAIPLLGSLIYLTTVRMVGGKVETVAAGPVSNFVTTGVILLLFVTTFNQEYSGATLLGNTDTNNEPARSFLLYSAAILGGLVLTGSFFSRSTSSARLLLMLTGLICLGYLSFQLFNTPWPPQ